MSEEAIAAIQADLAHDLYELAASHREEITRLMEEFDAHDIDTSVKLDGYERDRRQQMAEVGAPPASQPPPPNNEDNEGNNVDNNDNDNNDEEE